MLVLSRKKGEVIRIGEEIEVEVVEVRGNKVRLGITAPPELLILRDELLSLAITTSDATDPAA